MVKGNPASFLRVSKPEVDFKAGTPVYSEQVYQRSKQNLQRLIDDGFMCRDGELCFYLYRLTMNEQSQTGLMALSSVEEYNNGQIKKHEHTRPEQVNDRANHIMYTQAQVGPVLSIFRHRPEIEAIFEKITQVSPEYDFESEDGVSHQIWVVIDAENIEALVLAFAELECLYIADGHHRSAAAAEVARRLKEKNPSHTGQEHYNFFLNVMFPDDRLRILPYYRVVRDLNGMTAVQLLEKATRNFSVTPRSEPVIPNKNHRFGLYCEKKWYELEAKEENLDTRHPSQLIDSAVLSNNLLLPILGIKNLRTDKRIDFIGGIRGVGELVRLVDSGEYAVAFSLYPASVEQLLKVADAGEVMPPKSTWFEPKLRSGMVVNLFDE